jgi:hypothetical protein
MYSGAVLRRELHALRDNRAVDNRLYVRRIPAATGFASGGRERRQTERDSREHPAAPSVPNDALSTLLPALKSELPVFSSGVPINIQTPRQRGLHRSGY